MIVYIIATLLTVLFAYISVKYKARIDRMLLREYTYIKPHVDMWYYATLKIFQISSAVPLVLVAAFRYRVGTDWGTYVLSFESVRNGNRGYYGEPGYILLQKFVAWFSGNVFWLFLTSALIFGTFYFVGIYRMSVNPVISAALLVCTSLYFSYLNGMRQGMALSILFFSIQFVEKRKLKKFMVFVLIAMGFHASSVAFIIVYILYSFKINIKTVFLYTFIFGVVGISGGQVVRMVIMRTKYGHYYQSIFADEGFELQWFLISTAILVVMCFYYEHAQKREDFSWYNLFLWMQMGAVIFCMISGSIPGANRVVWMFNIGQLLSLPRVIQLEQDKRWRVVLSVIIVGLYALATFIAIRRGSHRVLPYQILSGK